MNRCVVARLLALVVGACLPAVSWAEFLRFLAQDQQGAPLAGVVVELLTPADTQPAQASLPLAVMDQNNKRFVPELLVIQAGQQVSFPNSDNIRHHVYSFSATKPFELKLYAGHPEQPVSFPQPGVVVLGCNIHDAMVGYIYVAASPRVAQSGPDGRGEILLSEALGTHAALGVWHAQQRPGPERLNIVTLDTPGSGTQPKRLADGTFLVSVEIAAPAPHDTFKARFRAAEK